ncbi:MAG: S-methyl-5-thioribose-1-phosphate isomerase [Eubacteriales bacterium]|jgi:methylthioribose-1-phosphate isomerase|nr:S-methyl-5-thioribose-1-phosphate isomerase [Eubacteriales bacterium]
MDNTKITLPDTVSLDDDAGALVIIDQTRLPGELVMLALTKQEEIWEAIKTLRVRGAPAIGVSAAIGLYLAAKEIASAVIDEDEFFSRLKVSADYLASSRPTAVNLFWALDRMYNTALSCAGQGVGNTVKRLLDEALSIREGDIASCRRIGEYGLTLINDGDGILTHCNAGQLAAVRYGTALAPIHLGRERGMNFRVYTDETRPLLQGMRLSATELVANGVDVTIICDNMVSQVMRAGLIRSVLVGADRIAANGDVCNKIGTSGVAILAAHYCIPFYVLAPVSTIDLCSDRGDDIEIEQRSGAEVSDMWFKKRMAPEGATVYNPAFDYTDNGLITALVTDRGIIRPPYRESIAEIIK